MGENLKCIIDPTTLNWRLVSDTSDTKSKKIKKVVFNDPATVVIWEDGTKTVVKCQPGDTYSKETGLALCIAKKFLGNKGNFNDVFKKWIPEDKPREKIVELDGFKVGDEVRIVNRGKYYSDYEEWVDQYVADFKLRKMWAPERNNLDHGTTGIIRAIGPYLMFDRTLAYVQVGKSGYIFGVTGLEKV